LGPIRRDASCTWDLATHDIAMLDFLLNEMPISVSAQASSFLQREMKVYDYATIQLKYDNFQFSLIVSWYACEKIRSWYIVGSKSMLKFDDMNKVAPITIYHKYAIVTTNAYKTPDIVIRESDTIIPHVSQEEPLLLEVRCFLDSIKYNRRPISDGAQGARVVKILEAVEESIKKRGMPVSMRD
jgi:predicted dehydrogenase